MNGQTNTEPTPSQLQLPEYQSVAPTYPATPELTSAQSNSDYQYGFLRASDPVGRIEIKEYPSVDSPSYSYGLNGDRVRVLGNTHDESGILWWEVYFEGSDTLGWVRDGLILLDGI